MTSNSGSITTRFLVSFFIARSLAGPVGQGLSLWIVLITCGSLGAAETNLVFRFNGVALGDDIAVVAKVLKTSARDIRSTGQFRGGTDVILSLPQRSQRRVLVWQPYDTVRAGTIYINPAFVFYTNAMGKTVLGEIYLRSYGKGLKDALRPIFDEAYGKAIEPEQVAIPTDNTGPRPRTISEALAARGSSSFGPSLTWSNATFRLKLGEQGALATSLPAERELEDLERKAQEAAGAELMKQKSEEPAKLKDLFSPKK